MTKARNFSLSLSLVLGAGTLAVGLVPQPMVFLAGMAAALSMAAGIVLTKRWGKPDGVGLLGFTGLQLAMGGVMLLPVTLAVEGLPGSVTVPNLAGFAYLSVIGALAAYALWFRGIQRLPTMVVSFLGFLSPLVATVLGFVFLGESLSGWQLAGAVLVLGAVFIVQGAERPTPGLGNRQGL